MEINTTPVTSIKFMQVILTERMYAFCTADSQGMSWECHNPQFETL